MARRGAEDAESVRDIDAISGDLLVDERLIAEIKSVERVLPVRAKQLLTYLRSTKQPVWLLTSYGGETLKEGLRRLVNNHHPSAPLREITPSDGE